MGAGARERLPALLTLALPVLAGLAFMAAFGAPGAYLALNGGALLLGLGWLALAPQALLARPRILAAILLALFAAPLLTGPELNGVTRWLPLGPVTLHAGMLVLPLLLRLAAENEEDAPVLLSAGLLVALSQPDAASAAALTFGAVGLYHVRPDWRLGLVVIVGFFATILAALTGELAPQPFVERVLVDAAYASPFAAAGLFAALLTGFLLALFATALPRPARFAVAGSLFGFAIMALMNTYPTPLIGFGASPIIGYALALACYRKNAA